MPSFTVTAAGQSVQLDQTGGGQAAFTVTNTTAAALTGRLLITPQAPAVATWFTVAQPATRTFAPGTAESVTAQIVVPAGTTPGTYSFRLDAVAENNPDEDFTEGPPVSFEVKAAEAPPKKPFPWWILIIVALVLIAGVAVFALTRGGKPGTPKMSNPPEGFPIPAVPASIPVAWQKVKKADSYTIEVQRCGGSPCSDANAQTISQFSVAGDKTSANITLTQPVSGRVRVIAVKGTDRSDPGIRTFAFVGPGAPPIQVGEICKKCLFELKKENPSIQLSNEANRILGSG
jgi:hypothetical protein